MKMWIKRKLAELAEDQKESFAMFVSLLILLFLVAFLNFALAVF